MCPGPRRAKAVPLRRREIPAAGAQETARDVSTASGACEAFLAQQPGTWCLPTSLHCRVPTPPVRFMRKPRQRPRTWHTLVLCSRVFCLTGRTEPSSRAWLLVTAARGRWAAGRVRGPHPPASRAHPPPPPGGLRVWHRGGDGPRPDVREAGCGVTRSVLAGLRLHLLCFP